MALLMMLLTMLAFATVYALITAMLGDHRQALLAALLGDGVVQQMVVRPEPVQPRAVAASRCLSRA
jgi:hypothetical protein